MYRIGQGCDQHRYKDGKGFYLGGVFVDAEYGVVAHSDGDVVLHAVTDSLLGAVSGGDIGELFPDTHSVNCNRDSAEFLLEAMNVVSKNGYSVVNLDLTIQAQKPKIGHYKKEIAISIAKLLNIGSDRVSVKAKTAEGMDAIGRCEGIRVDVVALVRENEDAE